MAIAALTNHGPGYPPPSSETTRTSILVNLKGKADEYIEVKESTE